jgi:hypothetical protein
MHFIGGQLDGSWWSQVGLELNAPLAGFGLAYVPENLAQLERKKSVLVT